MLTSVPEIIDPVFAKTSLQCSFSVIENERFGLISAKTGYEEKVFEAKKKFLVFLLYC